MNENRDPSVAQQLRAIRDMDDLCDAFEKQLGQNEIPQLENYLDKVDPEQRPKLIRELLALTRHHLSESDMRLQLKDYLERHPEHSNTIIGVLREETLNVSATSADSKQAVGKASQGLQTGEAFGKFEILEEIARGGMGVIFKAHQQDLDRVVALKVIISGHLATDVEIKRFKREARAVAALEHNNIVSIYEVDQVETLHYFTMNYFEGVTLDTWTKMRPHDLADRVSVLIQLCEGIDYAHQRGIIHRDLKPANILVDQDGCVQIIDFGLAKEFDCLRTAITGEHLIGTPQYMAPEQLLGHQAKFGPRSDIYAIGAVLYELVTDRKPFAANTLFELMQQVDSVEPAPPHLMGTDFAAWNRRNLSPLPGQRSVPKIHLRHRNRRGAARTASRSWGRNESHHGPKAAYQIPGSTFILGGLGLLLLAVGAIAILVWNLQGSNS